jgi:4-amino-4-deoxy-L-arabinose transferase-like glycosyltransferase
LAAGLRFANLDYGHGIDARPDEPGVLFALNRLGVNESPTPTLVLYGGGFFLPLFAGVRAIMASRGMAAPPPIAGNDAFEILVMVRAWSAALSTVTVGLTYAAGTAVSGQVAGLIAAGLLAVSPLAVREAHSGKPDSAAAFAIALLVWCATRRWQRLDLRAACVGAATALAVSTKGQIATVPAAVLILLSNRPASAISVARTLAIGAGVFGSLVVVFHWYAVLHPIDTLDMLPSLMRAVRDPSYLPGNDTLPSALRYHASVSLRYGCGLGMAVLALPALLWGLFQRRAWILSVVVICGSVPLLVSRMLLARFALVVLPPLAVLVGCLIVALVQGLTKARALRLVLVASAAAVLLVPTLIDSVWLVQRLGRVDTRIEAGAWLAENLPTGSRVVVWGAPPLAAPFGSPPLPPVLRWFGLEPTRWKQLGVDWLVWHSYPLPYSSEPLPPEAAGFERVAEFSPFEAPSGRLVLEPLDAFYLPLVRDPGIVRPGPRIEVLRRRPTTPPAG